MNDPQGSVWRKWDLHFHTPSSFDYEDKSISNKEIVEKLVSKEIECVVITDHHLIDCERILELNELSGDKINFFAGIELRAELGGKSSVHFIGIFPHFGEEQLTTLWTKLQGRLDLTPEDVKSKGDENIYHDLKDTAKVIHDLGGLVSVHAGTKSNSFEKIGNAQSFKQALKRDLVYESIDFFELGKLVDTHAYNDIVFPAIGVKIPLVICSDNHDINEYDEADYTWIKADPTFEGLKQVIIEPELRCQIGDRPEKLDTIDSNKTKFIESITISKNPSSSESEIWFENLQEIPINSDLVSVIGNKGTGKSAFTDILALAGRTKNFKHFSFLNSKKFRHPRRNKSKSFESSLKWKDGSRNDAVNLDKDPESFEAEKVKYLPQKFLEELCNPEAYDEKNLFEKELKDVIFSWIPETERLGKNSLDEIIDYKSEIAYEKVDSLRDEISRINKQYLEVANKLHPNWKEEIQKKLKEKNKELAAHKVIKPKKVAKPKDDLQNDPELNKIHERLTDCNIKLDNILRDEKKYNRLLSRINDRITSGERVSEKLLLLDKNIEDAKKGIDSDLNVLGFKFGDLVKFKIEKKDLDEKIDRLKEVKVSVTSHMKNIDTNLKDQREKKKKLEEKLDEPNKKYQKYLTDKEKWVEKKEKIEGNNNKLGTLNYFNNELKNIQKVYPNELKRINKQRKGKVLQIHGEYEILKEDYKKLYKPVSDFIATHEQLTKDFNLSFDVSIESRSFKDEFLGMIHSGKKGSFYGDIEGYEYLSTIHDSTNFNEAQSLTEFLQEIDNNLLKNKETHNWLKIQDQLKKNISPKELFDFLYGLKYLKPSYQLKLDNKELYELSPGERGTLLLIFYLLIDRSDLPIVIDQPEENLDNETVYKVLVYCIREAKKRRQIIIVTHNPNLAVVCDSEQIIVADIDKKNKNEVSYVTGSIENSDINKKIIDILEGTRPAFNNRGSKYFS